MGASAVCIVDRRAMIAGVLSLCICAFQSPVRAQDGRVTTAIVSARVAPAARRVTVNVDAAPLMTTLQLIAQQAGLSSPAYDKAVVSPHLRVTLHVRELPVAEAFQAALQGTGLVAIVQKGDVAIIRGGVSATQAGTISGIVLDAATKRPLRAVKIGLDGNDQVTETGEDGSYRLLNILAGTHTVSAKLIGYRKVTRVLTVQADASVDGDLILRPSASVLDQVVVTGTVIPTELKAVPNAITVITAKDIERRGITHIDQLFRGDVPGLFSQENGSNNFLGAVVVFSRGATALSGTSAGTGWNTNPIKTYVDGVELADSRYLSQIDPKSIERIEILTGPQASTIYGSNALNGVMQIFTKRGTTNTPQLALTLLSGWVENNFSSNLAPQHDYSAQMNSVEGHLSYNAGASWNYTGHWTPGKQSTRTSEFGGIRGEWHTAMGVTTADITLRRETTQDLRRGNTSQALNELVTSGYFTPQATTGHAAPQTNKLEGQTAGITIGYRPTTWWSHDAAVGTDEEATSSYTTAPEYRFATDSTLSITLVHRTRQSERYATTLQVPLTRSAQVDVTAGGDAWQVLEMHNNIQPVTLVGSLGSGSITRQPDHNSGAFLQTQLAIQDNVFLTYGFRAEWNPSFGRNSVPNIAPRYGIAVTKDVGIVTAKARASYGRSTRPPAIGLAAGSTLAQAGNSPQQIADYGNYYWELPAPDLLPEHQQGGEGGVELYLGNRVSLVVTRYNQTVDNLIDSPVVDSTRSLTTSPFYKLSLPDADGYYWASQIQPLNIGSIRNQGWELQGSLNTGPFTIKETYSWTKSRVSGITPKYRALFSANNYPQYQPGATFQYLPEHTWATNITYAHGGATVALAINGIGQLFSAENQLYLLHLSSTRLLQNRYRFQTSNYSNANSGYAMADLNASQRLSSCVEGVLQVQNLMDRYVNDFNATYATIGRQIKMGMRVRF